MLGNGKATLSEEFYVKWLNDQLSKCSPPLLVFDLVEDNICNGVAIGLLLEVVGCIKIDGLLLQPITVVERLHNIHEVFTVLRRFEVKLNNIQPEDIMSGDHETVLQLLSAINSHFDDKPRYGRRLSAFSNNEYKSDNSGRNSAWSMSSGSRRTPIQKSPSGQTLSKSKETYTTNPVPYTEYMWSNDQSSNMMRNAYFNNAQAQISDHTDRSDTLSPKPKSFMNSTYFTRSTSGSPKSIHSRRETSESVTPTNTNMHNQSILRSQNYSNNLSNNSRHYSSTYGHQNSPMRNTNSNDEIPQFLDPMDEINYLRAQLKSLSRLIESEGSDAVRTASELHSQASRCTQTEVAVLLDRHAKRANAELSDLKRLMRSKEASIQHLEAENARLNESIQNLMKTINKHESMNSINGCTQNNSNNVTSNGPTVGMDCRLLESSHKTELYQSNFVRNMEPYINPQRFTSPTNHFSPERFNNSTSGKSPERVMSPERQASPSRLISPGRQLSPTSKRFPHYAPYIHSITRSTSRSPDQHKSSNNDVGYMKKTTFSITPTQTQIVKSPTQRLLMQNLTSTSY